MKRLGILGLMLALVFSTVTVATDQKVHAADTPANPIEKPGWELTKNDEFNGTTLDESLWVPRYLGFRTPLDRGNADYYFKDGSIVLRVTESMPTYFTSGSSMKVSSIQTAQGDFHQGSYVKDHDEPYKSNFSQQYGYFEIRAKSQSDLSGHSAFWLNTDDPTIYQEATRNTSNQLEIDVFENYQQNKFKFNLLNPKGTSGVNKSYASTYPFDFSVDYHIYAVEWDPDNVKYYVDNQLVHTHSASNLLKKQMFVYLSLYVNTWGGDSAPTYPAEFAIDYFRAYKKAGNTGKIEAENMTLSNYGVETSSSASGGKLIKVNENQTGTAQFTFNGPSGIYDLDTAYFDENDGTSNFSLSVNGAVKDSWTANQDLGSAGVASSNLVVRTTKEVALNMGDTITLTGAFQQWEYARIDYVEYKPASGFTESFNGQSTGSAPTGWTLLNDNGTVTIAEAPSATDKSANINRTGTGINRTSMARTLSPLSGTVTIQAKVRNDAPSNTWFCLPYVYDSAGNMAATVAFEKGSIKSRVGGTWTTVQSYTSGTWYDLKLVINTDTDTYDLYVDNTLKLSNAQLRTAVTDIAKVEFYAADSNTGSVYVDNVTVH